MMKRILLLLLMAAGISGITWAQRTPFYKDWGGLVAVGANGAGYAMALPEVVLDLVPQNAPKGAFHRIFLGPMAIRLDKTFEEKFYPGIHGGYYYFPNAFGNKARFYFGYELTAYAASIKKDSITITFINCFGDFKSAQELSIDQHLAIGMMIPIKKILYLLGGIGVGVQIFQTKEIYECQSDGSKIILGTERAIGNMGFMFKMGLGFRIPQIR